MGNVFCASVAKMKELKPLFYLGIESGVIKDISGNYDIVNNGGVVSNNMILLNGGYIDTKALSLLKSLWESGSFSIDFNIKFNSVQRVGYVFGSCHVSSSDAPCTIYIDTNSHLNVVCDSTWGNALKTTARISLGVEYNVSVVVKENVMKLFLNGVEQGRRNIGGVIRDYPLLVAAQSANVGVSVYKPDASLRHLKIFDVATG